MRILTEITVHEEAVGIVDVVSRSALAFLEAGGTKVAHETVGSFRRLGHRGRGIETVTLIVFEAPDSSDPFQHARRLESVLRATLAAVAADAGDVRAFVGEST
jgi:hypothetical protein